MKRIIVRNTFVRYCVSYLIVLVLPITAVATSFNTQFIADYRQSHIGRLHLSAEKTMSDLERQLGQMKLISMQFSFASDFDANQLTGNTLIYRPIREQLEHYRYISNYVNDIVYINCRYPNTYYTTMGTYNSEYFNMYRKSGGTILTAADYLNGHDSGFWVPAAEIASVAPAFKHAVQYAAPVFNIDDGWLMFMIPMNQLQGMLDMSASQLEVCAILNDDGAVLYDSASDVDWQRILDADSQDDAIRVASGDYLMQTQSTQLGLKCIYSISEHSLLEKVDRLSQQFMVLLLLTLVVGSVLAIAFSRQLAGPIDSLIDTARRTLGTEDRPRPGSISDVQNALVSVHRENQQLQSQYIESERHNVLMRLMSGQYSSPEALEEDCTAVGVPTNGHMYTVVLIDELRMPTSETEQEIERLFDAQMRVFGFRFSERQCQIFLLAEAEEGCHERAALFERLKGRYPGVMMAMGGQTGDLMHVQQAYQDGVFARRLAQMKGGITPVISDAEHTHEGQAVYPKQEIDALYNILKQKDVEKLSFIQETLMFSLRMLGDDPVYQQALCYDIISTYNRALSKLGIGGRSDRQPFKTSERGSLHIDQLLDIMQGLYNEAIDSFIADETPEQGNDIAEILKYIDSQKDNILNVYEVAERFGVSPSNLSHQFKRATGETLSNYIAEHKLRVARELLISTDMDVAQIGERLGYTHPSSFIRMFHKVEGITPAQYREEHSPSQAGPAKH